MYEYIDPNTGKKAPLIADDVFQIIWKNRDLLDSTIIYDRDFGYDYFGFKTLEKSYLLKINGEVAERPQHMLMRVAVGIHKEDIDAAIETYNLMSERWFTHATPTLFNAGTPKPQLSSCFLLQMKDDSIEGIYNTLKQLREDFAVSRRYRIKHSQHPRNRFLHSRYKRHFKWYCSDAASLQRYCTLC